MGQPRGGDWAGPAERSGSYSPGALGNLAAGTARSWALNPGVVSRPGGGEGPRQRQEHGSCGARGARGEMEGVALAHGGGGPKPSRSLSRRGGARQHLQRRAEGEPLVSSCVGACSALPRRAGGHQRHHWEGWGQGEGAVLPGERAVPPNAVTSGKRWASWWKTRRSGTPPPQPSFSCCR